MNDGIRIKSQHVQQNIKHLRSNTAVTEERVDGVVPLEQSVAVLQRLLRLVVPRDAANEICHKSKLQLKQKGEMHHACIICYLITWNQWLAMSRQISRAAARVNSGYRLLSITKKPAVEML